MKRLGFISLMFVLVLASCNRPTVDPSVRFYMDGHEITTDTVTVPLNSYQEITIQTVSPEWYYEFYWQLPTGYPMELGNGSDNFHLFSQSSGFNGNSAVYTLNAEFRMFFSDTLYHVGDVCRLRAYSPDYQRVLKVVVE